MATGIQDFFNRAAQKQFARDFLFRVKQITISGMQMNGEEDLLYARSAALPGRTIEDKTVNYSGQIFHLPGRSTYTNSEGYSIEFYHDQNLEIRSKLEQASRVAFDNETTTGNICMPGEDSYIILDVLSIPCQQGSDLTQGGELETIKQIKLVGVGIRDIGEVSYSIADGTGEILTLPATFSYHFYQDFS